MVNGSRVDRKDSKPPVIRIIRCNKKRQRSACVPICEVTQCAVRRMSDIWSLRMPILVLNKRDRLSVVVLGDDEIQVDSRAVVSPLPMTLAYCFATPAGSFLTHAVARVLLRNAIQDSRSLVVSRHDLSMSHPTNLRPISQATTAVVPPPTNGSQIHSPGSENADTMRAMPLSLWPQW